LDNSAANERALIDAWEKSTGAITVFISFLGVTITEGSFQATNKRCNPQKHFGQNQWTNKDDIL
jgi:hypothetical protein